MQIAIGIPQGYSGGLAKEPLPLPALSLDLTRSSTALQLTTVRAGDAWAEDNAGVYSLFPASIPRITDKGLLVEAGAINSIRNNSMQGAVAGTPGTLPANWGSAGTGLTRTVVGVGVQNGIDYIDIRLQGSASSTIDMEVSTQTVAANGQTWTSSAFVAIVGGSLANITAFSLLVLGNTAGGGFVEGSTVSLAGATSSLARFSITKTFGNASTERVNSRISITPTGAFDITLRIGWPQLELGAFLTSPIRTTSAAVTRAADVVTLGSFAAINQTEGTLFVEAVPQAISAIEQVLVSIDTVGSAAERHTIRITSGSAAGITLDGGAAQCNLNFGSIPINVPSKIAHAYKLNDFAGSMNGATVITDTAGTMPTTTTFYLGSRFGGLYMNGYIRRVAYWNTRLTNAQLVSLTS